MASPLLNSDRCVECRRTFYLIVQKYMCNDHDKAPLCILCIVSHHDNCRTEIIVDKMVRLMRDFDDWKFCFYNPNIRSLSTQSCRLREAMEEVHSLVIDREECFRRTVEFRLREVRKWEQLREEMEKLFCEVVKFRQELPRYIHKQPTPQLTLANLIRGEQAFFRLKDSFSELLESPTIECMSKLQKLIRSMYPHVTSPASSIESIASNRSRMTVAQRLQRCPSTSGMEPVAYVAPKNLSTLRQRSRSISQFVDL